MTAVGEVEEEEEGEGVGKAWRAAEGRCSGFDPREPMLLRQLFDPTHRDALGAFDREAQGPVPHQLHGDTAEGQGAGGRGNRIKWKIRQGELQYCSGALKHNGGQDERGRGNRRGCSDDIS